MTRALKWWLALALVVVFGAGVGTGLFAGARHHKRMVFKQHRPIMGEQMRERLRRHLALTPEQEDKVGPIVDRTAAELEAIRQETQQRIAETMNASHQEIAPLLNPEQREKLSEIRERHGRMRRRHFRPGHGPHSPPP
jgi:Spy/CpxP family protein refolding chaperone